jgi:glutaredoxin
MVKIELVKTPGCKECAKVKAMIEAEVKPQFPDLEVEEIDALTPRGQELVLKHGIMASPGVLINGELFSTGGANRDKLIEKLQSLGA